MGISLKTLSYGTKLIALGSDGALVSGYASGVVNGVLDVSLVIVAWTWLLTICSLLVAAGTARYFRSRRSS